jgi:hypothetical protein
MYFQGDSIDISKYIPFIIAGILILGGIIILKIGLAIAKAQSKTNFKWVAISYILQYGVTLFVSTPMLLEMILQSMECAGGGSCDYMGPDPGFIAMSVIFSVVLVLNLINLIHKPGLKRSFILTLLVLGPIIGANYLIFRNIGSVM